MITAHLVARFIMRFLRVMSSVLQLRKVYFKGQNSPKVYLLIKYNPQHIVVRKYYFLEKELPDFSKGPESEYLKICHMTSALSIKFAIVAGKQHR